MPAKSDTPARAAARARFAHLVDDDGPDSGVIDPENPPMTDADLASLRPAAQVHPQLVVAKSRGGRPRSDAPKVPVSIRLDPDVVDALKAGGDGWQSRANTILRVGLKLPAT